MAGADLAAVHAVVAEVLVGDLAVLVADQPELPDGLPVERHLGLGVAGPDLQVGGELVDEDLAGLLLVADVGGVAVALVGEPLHERVAVVAADAHAEEGDAVLAPGRVDLLQDALRLGVAGVGEGVGEEHHPVGRALAVALDRLLVAEGDAGPDVGGSGRAQLLHHVLDPVPVAPEAGHRQPGLGLVAEGDQGEGVVVAQFVGEDVQGRADQVEAAGLRHGAGDVDDERERRGRALGGRRGGLGGEADAEQRPVGGSAPSPPALSAPLRGPIRAPSTFSAKPGPFGRSYPWRKLLTNSSGRTSPGDGSRPSPRVRRA